MIDVRNQAELEVMLEEIKELKKEWYDYYRSGRLPMAENAKALRNYTALRGAEKALRWCLGDQDSPLW
tara:strand:- start:2907 stop:3110 length:204 start_codon:yes stop_codon:yes gene_type:complete